MNVKETVLAMATVIAFPMVASTAQAQETVVTETVAATVAEVVDPVASEALTTAFAAICVSNAVLSDKAQLACSTVAMPKATKTGEMFRNVGIGAEFNTLIRNAAAFQ